MVLVVMQPTYLSWMGYFDLIDQSDIFVFLDTVQFEKQSWQQRNRIKTSQGVQWLTVPVFHSFGQKIMDVRINNHTNWKKKHWISFFTNYQKAPFWQTFAPELERIYQQEWGHLAELNIHIIKKLCEMAGLSSKLVRTSELPPLPGRKAEPLIALCKMFGAEVYLSPEGSRTYLESDELFREVGISLAFQDFDQAEYPQLYGEFISCLSVVDLLMNTGPEGLKIIRSGRRPCKNLQEIAIDLPR